VVVAERTGLLAALIQWNPDSFRPESISSTESTTTSGVSEIRQDDAERTPLVVGLARTRARPFYLATGTPRWGCAAAGTSLHRAVPSPRSTTRSSI